MADHTLPVSPARPPPAAGSWISDTLSPGLRGALVAALSAPYRRVQRLEAEGGAIWLKRAEQLSLRWRLQKGDPRQALAAERAGLEAWGALGLPVAPLVAAGPDHLATAEVGPPMSDLFRGLPAPAPERLAAVHAAGEALATCHRAGMVHGRPKLRDICWDGQAARFIDLERYAPHRHSPRAMALDLLILLHSLLVLDEEGHFQPEFAALLAAWRAGAPEAVQAQLARMLPGLGRLGFFARQAQRLKPDSRELTAVPRLYAALVPSA